MLSKFIDYLNRIYFGDIPPIIESLLKDLVLLTEYIEANKKNVNVSSATFDIGNSIPKELKDRLADKWASACKEDIDVLKEVNRHYWTSLYLETLRDPTCSVRHKYDINIWLCNLMEDSILSTGNEIMNGQQKFVSRLQQDRDTLEKELNKSSDIANIVSSGQSLIETSNIETIPNSINQQINDYTIDSGKAFSLSILWKHDEATLIDLSVGLYEDGYTESEDSFKNVFYEKSKTKTNWRKKKTSLIYLFGLLFLKNDTLPDRILILITEKILHHGNPIIKSTLKRQLKQIDELFEKKPDELTSEYADLHSLNRIIIAKKGKL